MVIKIPDGYYEATAMDLINIPSHTPVQLYAAGYKGGSPTKLKSFIFQHASCVAGPIDGNGKLDESKKWVMVSCEGATFAYVHSKWRVFIKS